MNIVKDSYIVMGNMEDMKRKEYSLELEGWKTLKRLLPASQPSRKV